MTLEGSSASAIIIFILVILIALAVSLLYGWKAIEATGWFGSQVFISSVMNLFLCACALFGWFLYALSIDEAVFFGGLVLGLSLFVAGEAALIATLYYRRKKLVDASHTRADSPVSEQE
ncbi:hypothetical protein [Lentibacillus salicampi]|uniref:Uncharacterized protein n=1 Tax=Lentibacillus salicampi TaxID=175306 RepID=A0A4Y9ADG6_9BACI|nr:hypothetical protein [Lentibacillus salicampi]TFJ92444.1 hypothetical protein E4U82_12410 [Lentibacillus salicampi]